MKMVLFAAALMVSGAALAQEDPQTTDDTMTTTTTTTTTTGTTVAPSNAAPERDARGIPVISDAAVAPPGANQPVTMIPPGAVVVPNPNQAAAFQTQAATTSYPACSRTVTDHCVQTYERGRPH